MQFYILHCPALGKASPIVMDKLSAMVFDSVSAAKDRIAKELAVSYELYSLDDFRAYWNSPESACLMPDCSFIATIAVRSVGSSIL